MPPDQLAHGLCTSRQHSEVHVTNIGRLTWLAHLSQQGSPCIGNLSGAWPEMQQDADVQVSSRDMSAAVKPNCSRGLHCHLRRRLPFSISVCIVFSPSVLVCQQLVCCLQHDPCGDASVALPLQSFFWH